MYGVTRRISPMRTNANTIRTSFDSSLRFCLGGVGELIRNLTEPDLKERGRIHRHGKDGSGPAVSGPARIPSPPHGLPPLPAYIPNKSDRSGTPTAAGARSGVCTRGG